MFTTLRHFAVLTQQCALNTLSRDVYWAAIAKTHPTLMSVHVHAQRSMFVEDRFDPHGNAYDYHFDERIYLKDSEGAWRGGRIGHYDARNTWLTDPFGDDLLNEYDRTLWRSYVQQTRPNLAAYKIPHSKSKEQLAAVNLLSLAHSLPVVQFPNVLE